MKLSHDHLDVQDAYQAELDNFIEGGKKRILTNREFCGLSFQDFNTFFYAEYKQVNKEGDAADSLFKTVCDMLNLKGDSNKPLAFESMCLADLAKLNVVMNLHRQTLLDALDQFLRQSNRHRVIQGFQLHLENKQAA